jgi:hypothetical protein
VVNGRHLVTGQQHAADKGELFAGCGWRRCGTRIGAALLRDADGKPDRHENGREYQSVCRLSR